MTELGVPIKSRLLSNGNLGSDLKTWNFDCIGHGKPKLLVKWLDLL